VFKPTIFKRVVYHLTNRFLLRKSRKVKGKGIRRMPFRKALKRDWWEPSPEAVAVGERWDSIRRSGGNASFEDDSDNVSIP
jgi:hypothetical protein